MPLTTHSSATDGSSHVTSETLCVSRTIEAAREAVFAVLADPTRHPDIDGTGWLRGSTDQPITAVGQVFGMAMYHDNHPDKHYDMANLVTVFDAPAAIAWEPGQHGADGELGRGGWVWRYDLRSVDESRTEVSLTYDWSAVPPPLREHIPFPPFPIDHLEQSLANLARLATSG
jgi:hypothetical protein